MYIKSINWTCRSIIDQFEISCAIYFCFGAWKSKQFTLTKLKGGFFISYKHVQFRKGRFRLNFFKNKIHFKEQFDLQMVTCENKKYLTEGLEKKIWLTCNWNKHIWECFRTLFAHLLQKWGKTTETICQKRTKPNRLALKGFGKIDLKCWQQKKQHKCLSAAISPCFCKVFRCWCMQMTEFGTGW